MSPDDWWKHGIIYQIYPRSMQDSTGDGLGDLRGIVRRLDYLVALGVDAIWISPFYPSPMADFGYDISNYCAVDPRFGTLADFDALAAAAHERGMKLVLDFVPNHTSNQHPWFRQSRSTRHDPKRDWYLWRDPAPDGGPPNNWLSNFGGPAWTFDESTGQYYLHLFLPEQPDLNWRHPEVRTAMYDVMRFWLARGVDGFRIDVLYHVIKDENFRDNPPNPDFEPGGDPSHRLLQVHTSDRPEVQQIVREMRKVTDAFSDDVASRILIGELHLPLERLMAYYGYDAHAEADARADAGGTLRGLQMPFNFALVAAPCQADAIDTIVRNYEAALPPGAAGNWVLGNHDESRIATRVGPANARLAAMLLLTLHGTPTLYYGDEIGMTDVPITPDQVQDPLEKNKPGIGEGRDPQRTPMQWSDQPGAGFTQGTPWLPLADDWQRCNVSAQEGDPWSMLALYRTLIALRRAEPALYAGRFEAIDDAGPGVLAYARIHAERRLVVLLNFNAAPAEVPTQLLPKDARLLASTMPDRAETIDGALTLNASEGVVLTGV